MNDLNYAFMNEFGNYDFDFDNNDVSTHFIVVSILVKGSDKEKVEQEVQKIRQKYFYTEEMKSIKLLDNHHLRIQILNDLNDIPFYVYAYVVDKRKIRENSGITFKKTFIKFLNRMVYDDLSRTFEQLDLAIDEQETKEFTLEFKNYVKKRSIPDLFSYSSFGFNNSQSDILIQLADFIAGTIGKGYDKTAYTPLYSSFHKIIKNKIIGINLWPADYKDFLYDYKSKNPDLKYDDVILKKAINLTFQYIEKHCKSDEVEEKIRVDFLKFLIFNLNENPYEYVYTQEIIDNLNTIRELNITPHYVRSNIVAKLRDNGLLIASSNKGYKLPISLTDLYDFVNLSSLTIHPMIQRISKCRDQILLATNNEIDLLEKTEYDYLKRIIETEKLPANE